jgi:hypothetical protein
MWVELNQDRASVNNTFALRSSAAAYVSDRVNLVCGDWGRSSVHCRSTSRSGHWPAIQNVSVDLHSLGVNRVNLRVNVLTASTLFFTTPG